MKVVEIASFHASHRDLPWPWIAFDPTRTRFAFASSDTQIATRVLVRGAVAEGPSFTLPEDLALPTAPRDPERGATGGAGRGVRGFAIAPQGDLFAVTGVAASGGVVVTRDVDGERARSRIDDLAGPGFTAQAIAFERSGAYLWISAESATHTAVFRIDARTHALVGIVRSAPVPPPSLHELYLHPERDEVLLLASCGEDGTFARVVRCSNAGVEAVPSALDSDGGPAGFVAFSTDGERVHLAEFDVLRTHAWPGLDALSSIEFGADDFVSNYTGVLVGDRIFVDGEDPSSGDDAVMAFEPAGIVGTLLSAPVPAGMWAGRLGPDAVVTVESKGEPAYGRVVRIAV